MSWHYSSSLITISVAAAQSCAQGFLNPRSIDYSDCFDLPFLSGREGPGNIRLMPSRPPSSEIINTRAWTL